MLGIAPQQILQTLLADPKGAKWSFPIQKTTHIHSQNISIHSKRWQSRAKGALFPTTYVGPLQAIATTPLFFFPLQRIKHTVLWTTASLFTKPNSLSIQQFVNVLFLIFAEQKILLLIP